MIGAKGLTKRKSELKDACKVWKSKAISSKKVSKSLLLILGSAEKLYISVEFAISLYSEEDILNDTETAVSKLSKIEWCSNVVHSPVIFSAKY